MDHVAQRHVRLVTRRSRLIPLIVQQINSQVIDWSQWAVNQLIGGVNNFLTAAFCWVGVCPPGPFDLVCFGDDDFGRCTLPPSGRCRPASALSTVPLPRLSVRFSPT